MRNFWAGFEKAAASVIGVQKGVRSGLPMTQAPGRAATPKGPTSGVSVAPRSVAPPVPTPTLQPGAKKTQVPAPGAVKMPKVPQPLTQQGTGVASMSI